MKLLYGLYKANKKAPDAKQAIDSGLSEFVLFMKMIKAVRAGEYKMSRTTVLYLLATALYVISPIDLIPDFLLGLGFIDDIAVLSLFVKRIRTEIARFQRLMYFSEAEVVENELSPRPLNRLYK